MEYYFNIKVLTQESMKRLDIQYEEKRRAIFKCCMARPESFSWDEYWRQINELRSEMWPLFRGSGIMPPWHSKVKLPSMPVHE
jgi:hypothetical protein